MSWYYELTNLKAWRVMIVVVIQLINIAMVYLSRYKWQFGHVRVILLKQFVTNNLPPFNLKDRFMKETLAYVCQLNVQNAFFASDSFGACNLTNNVLNSSINSSWLCCDDCIVKSSIVYNPIQAFVVNTIRENSDHIIMWFSIIFNPVQFFNLMLLSIVSNGWSERAGYSKYIT